MLLRRQQLATYEYTCAFFFFSSLFFVPPIAVVIGTQGDLVQRAGTFRWRKIPTPRNMTACGHEERVETCKLLRAVACPGAAL